MWTDQAEGMAVDPGELTSFAESVCRRMGAGPDIAAEVAGHLVGADLAGHGSHGVLRLAQYVAELDRGELDPAARPVVIRQRGATLLVDARSGFGHFSTRVACDLVARKAAEYGIAAALIRHSGHIGRLGHYCELMADTGMVCLLTVGSAGPGVGAMVLPGTADRFLAANPWALGVPGAHPVVVDVSMTMLAEGKVTLAAARQAALPEGCVVDAAQRPSREPADYFAGGGLLPLGGLVAPHKGFGLALGAALLGGLATIRDPAPTLAGAQRPAGSTGHGELAGVCLIALDPDAFGGREPYRQAVAETTELIMSAERAGATVTVPGVPERRGRRLRERGLVLPAPVVSDLTGIGERFGITVPPPIRGEPLVRGRAGRRTASSQNDDQTMEGAGRASVGAGEPATPGDLD